MLAYAPWTADGVGGPCCSVLTPLRELESGPPAAVLGLGLGLGKGAGPVAAGNGRGMARGGAMLVGVSWELGSAVAQSLVKWA